MNYLILDTCTWLYLASGYYPIESLYKLDEEVRAENIIIVLPETIFLEWNKNKPSIRKNSEKIWGDRLDQPLANAKKLTEYFDGISKISFEALLEEIKEIKIHHIQESLAATFTIERIFDYHTTVKLPTTDEHRLKAVSLAIDKLAPFGEKNSVCDALILFSLIEFRNDQLFFQDNCAFVTDNFTDFSSKDDRCKVHPHLEDLFTTYSITYFYRLNDIVFNYLKQDDSTPSQHYKTLSFALESDFDKEIENSIDDDFIPEDLESIICQICRSGADSDDEVHFSKPFKIENETVIKIDPNQLWFDFVKDITITKIPEYEDTLQEGICNNCNTIYIKCQICYSITMLENADEEFMCEGYCGLVYKTEFNMDGYGLTYKIVKEDCTSIDDWLKEKEEDFI